VLIAALLLLIRRAIGQRRYSDLVEE
jgi:hypothetical protein